MALLWAPVCMCALMVPLLVCSIANLAADLQYDMTDIPEEATDPKQDSETVFPVGDCRAVLRQTALLQLAAALPLAAHALATSLLDEQPGARLLDVHKALMAAFLVMDMLVLVHTLVALVWLSNTLCIQHTNMLTFNAIFSLAHPMLSTFVYVRIIDGIATYLMDSASGWHAQSVV